MWWNDLLRCIGKGLFPQQAPGGQFLLLVHKFFHKLPLKIFISLYYCAWRSDLPSFSNESTGVSSACWQFFTLDVARQSRISFEQCKKNHTKIFSVNIYSTLLFCNKTYYACNSFEGLQRATREWGTFFHWSKFYWRQTDSRLVMIDWLKVYLK